jgi:hypothetical protein
VTEGLDEAPRGARQPGACADQGTPARAITGLMVTWHLRLELPATALAEALLQEAGVDRSLAGRQLDALLGGGGRQCHQVAMATGPGAGLDAMDFRGAEQHGPVAPVTFLATACAGGGLASAFGLVAGGIRRRGLAGGLGGLGHPSWQGLALLLELRELALALSHLALELRDVLSLALHGVLNGWWCELPLEWAKGKRPQDGVGMRVRGRRL